MPTFRLLILFLLPNLTCASRTINRLFASLWQYMASCRSIPPSLALLVPVPDKYKTINNALCKLLCKRITFLQSQPKGMLTILPFEILAGRTLLHGPRKLIFYFVAKLLRSLSPSKYLKVSFTLNCVLKRAKDFKTISNCLVLLLTCFRNFKPFLMNGNRSQIRQTQNKDIINILLTSSSRFTL